MRIDKEQFDSYAKEQGYKDGSALMDDIGVEESLYKKWQRKNGVSRKTLVWLFDMFGASEVLDFVEYDGREWEENLDLTEYM